MAKNIEGVENRPYRERVFLGAESTIPSWQQAVVDQANRWNSVAIGPTIPAGDRAIRVNAEVKRVTGQNNIDALVKAQGANPDDEGLRIGKAMVIQSFFLAARDGEDAALSAAVTSGDEKKIEAALPDGSRSIAKELRNCHISNTGVQAVLDQVDAIASRDMWDIAPLSPEEMRGFLAVTLQDVRKLGATIPRTDDDFPQLELALKYVAAQLREAAEEMLPVQTVVGTGAGADNRDLIRAMERVLEVPHDADPGVELDQQTKFIREYLHRIEVSNRTINDNNYWAELSRIEKVIDQFQPELQREIRARLSMDFCARAMRASKGVISSKAGMDMGQAAQTATEQGKEPTKDGMRFLFDENSKGELPETFRGAWDWIQYANFDYLGLLDQMAAGRNLSRLQQLVSEIDHRSLADVKKELNARTLRRDLKSMFDNERGAEMAEVNYDSDKDDQRKRWVKYFIIDNIAYGDGVPDPNSDWKGKEVDWNIAEQAFSVAEKATEALGERNVANGALQQGNDELAELIGFKKFRVNKRPRTAAGPAYHVNLIDTIPGATSWARQLEDKEPVPTNKPLYAKDVKWEKAAPGDYAFYHGATLGKIKRMVDDWLLVTEVLPKDVNIDKLRDLSDWINKAEQRSEVVEIDLAHDRLAVKRDAGGKFVDYQGTRVPVVESKSVVDGYPDWYVNGSYVYPKDKRAKPIRIQCEANIVLDPVTGNSEKEIVRFVEIGGNRYDVIEPDKPYVMLPVGKREVIKGNQGPHVFRTRVIQSIAEAWSTRERLGAGWRNLLELRRIATEQELWAGMGTFMTPRQFEKDIMNNKGLDLNTRFAKQEAGRKARENVKPSAPIKM